MDSYAKVDSAITDWLIYQVIILFRRTGPEVPFWNASFVEYSDGFGDVSKDHWLGLERVHGFVSAYSKLVLRVNLTGDFCKDGRKCSGLGDNGSWWGEWNFIVIQLFEF